MSISSTKICDKFHGVLSFVKLKKREKHSWSSVTFRKVADFDTPPWVFFAFFKLYKWYQIAQNASYMQQIMHKYAATLKEKTQVEV